MAERLSSIAGDGERRRDGRDGEALGAPASEPLLTAYRLPGAPLRLTPAPASRAWLADIQGGGHHYALRCLPLLIANQAGWLIRNSHRFFAVWTGGTKPSDLKIVYQGGAPPYPAVSNFGYGIVTWAIPYLFRTPPGYNLLVRGPTNWPKDGACPLDGIVETDWAEAPFTMNWKLTRPKVPVIFGADEPICLIMPQRRGELEAFQPEIRDIEAAPELNGGYRRWQESRARFQAEMRCPDSEAAREGWQRHYFQGTSVAGRQAFEHQVKLKIRHFEERGGAEGAPSRVEAEVPYGSREAAGSDESRAECPHMRPRSD